MIGETESIYSRDAMGDTVDYRAIFNSVESTLIRIGEQNGITDIRQRLDEVKTVATRDFSESDYYRTLVHVTFYSGFKAATVGAKIHVINRHFPDYRSVADYDSNRVDQILADRDMIRRRGKVEASVENARTFKAIVGSHGSFKKYLDSFHLKVHRRILSG
jgi:DNA-3-methyladenine glycosylase I